MWQLHLRGAKAWHVSGFQTKLVMLAQILSGKPKAKGNRLEITFFEREVVLAAQIHSLYCLP